ncbi:minor tail protein [Mycobacterium phage Theia]|uniref:Minor tail protein n=1 Tax=Mycobacterium phage Theia TaxID=1718172 RepID=A0A0N9SIJ5_9CAUD|nr:minor tail protein [Mycobacterium phage Theia]ALH46877.1 hypothetical protein SEA_THEIA_25 [Mycobacterium phage Theia]
MDRPGHRSVRSRRTDGARVLGTSARVPGEEVTPPFNPDSWMDVFLLLGLGVLGLAGTVLPIVLGKHGKKIDRIEEQVCNTHDTNMRDDLDELRELVIEGFADMRREFLAVRNELNTERIERIEGDKLRLVAEGGMQ